MTTPDPLTLRQVYDGGIWYTVYLCHEVDAKLAAQADQIAALQASLAALREAAEPYLVSQCWLDFRRLLQDHDTAAGEHHTMGEHRALARAMEDK